MFLRITCLLWLLFYLPATAQDTYPVANIPATLTENANAVVRLEQIDIKIESRRSMTITETRAVTILNENGLDYMSAGEAFDASTSVKAIEAYIYDQNGNLLKRIKKKDFKEHALFDSESVQDTRIIELDYTPIQYPFTMVYTSEVKTSNTAFIPQWSPVKGAFCSTQKSSVSIAAEPSLGFKYKEYNFDAVAVKSSTHEGNTYNFSAESIPAYRSEDYSPSFYKIRPQVLFGLERFNLEGVDGEALNWEAFGGWMYTNLLTGTDELPDATIAKVKAMTARESDPMQKAKIIYKYVQGKTRYVSIQLGIGGWKPMAAKDVDRLGYGDCKALTNYTRALLKAVGIEAYYTVVYSGSHKRDLHEDFVSMQGDHVILAIPDKGGIVWVECTSQSIPFGFQGDFTDNRMVLMVKPEGGKLVRTHIYDAKSNTQLGKGTYTINDAGGINGMVTFMSRGLQYDDKYYLETKSKEDLDKIYKSRFSNIANLKLKKSSLQNNSDSQEFTEDIALEAESYCNKSGNRIMFSINAFNQATTIPQRYRNRKMPFEINTGYYDADEVTINLPAGFTLEAMPENVDLKEKFGEYKAEYVLASPTQIVYKRSLQINDGSYTNADYESYRLFREKIARSDSAKAVLLKK